MLRVIVFAAGSDGDIHPHLGIAREMAARGHEILFFTSFDYLDLARSCGFEAVSILDERDKDEFESAKSLNPVGRIRSRCSFFSRKVSSICSLVASRIDERSILVSPPFASPLAKLLHLRYRVPYVSTVPSPANLCSLRNPPAFQFGEWFSRLPWPARRLLFHSLESLVLDPGFCWLLRDLLHTLQVPTPRRVVSEWSYSPQKILGLFPEWFCRKAPDWPPQLVLTGFPLFHSQPDRTELPAGLKRFLNAGPPPVVFTAGTETKTVQSFFEIALRTAQSSGIRAVFLTRLGDQLSALPDTIHYESYAPLHLLLPRAAGVVHHGGIGTTAQAIKAGIPQLVVPGRLDQYDNAQHVEKLGCGLASRSALGVAGAAEMLRRMQRSPEIAHACRNLRDRMVPGPMACSRAADTIEEVWHSTHREQGDCSMQKYAS